MRCPITYITVSIISVQFYKWCFGAHKPQRPVFKCMCVVTAITWTARWRHDKHISFISLWETWIYLVMPAWEHVTVTRLSAEGQYLQIESMWRLLYKMSMSDDPAQSCLSKQVILSCYRCVCGYWGLQGADIHNWTRPDLASLQPLICRATLPSLGFGKIRIYSNSVWGLVQLVDWRAKTINLNNK